jgi:hypothetical protein
MRGPDADDERVSIGGCAGNPAGADAATRPGYILSYDWLAKRGPHPLGHDTRKSIERPARCEGYDDRDGTRRIDLGGCGSTGSKKDGERE